MNKITDYKYRQLRNMIKRAKVRKPVKELLFCAIRDYKQQESVPETGTFSNGKKRCLVGAGLHNVGIYNSVDWGKAAWNEFGIREQDSENIINGFDNPPTNFDTGDITYATQALANEFGKDNRVAFLATKLGRELGAHG